MGRVITTIVLAIIVTAVILVFGRRPDSSEAHIAQVGGIAVSGAARDAP